MKTIKVRQIHWHDSAYPGETYWLSKEDVSKLIDEIYTDNKVGLAILRELKSKIEGR